MPTGSTASLIAQGAFVKAMKRKMKNQKETTPPTPCCILLWEIRTDLILFVNIGFISNLLVKNDSDKIQETAYVIEIPESTTTTNTQKEKTWIENEGKCSICNKNNSSKRHHPKNRETLSFWWVIAPKLEVILLCESCVIELDIRENKPNYNSNRTITKEVRDSVWRRDEGKCTQCGSNENLELDHIIPYSKGGSNSYRNIQLLCEECNRKKSDSIG